jgi:hypothetical protein
MEIAEELQEYVRAKSSGSVQFGIVKIRSPSGNIDLQMSQYY